MTLTPEEIAAERAAVVKEGREWIGTPYHCEARVKGKNGGADCMTTILGIAEATGMAKRLRPLPHYTHDYHLHTYDEFYMEGVLEFCDEVPGPPERAPLPGDIVMWKFGNVFAHGALVTDWPNVLHAFSHRPFGGDDVDRYQTLAVITENMPGKGGPRPRKFFCLKRWNVPAL